MAMNKRKRHTRTTVRVAKQPDKAATLARYGASSAFLKRAAGKPTIDLLSKAIANFSAVWSGSGNASRYSDGSFRVLYTATKLEVAKAERCHWVIELVFKTRVANRVAGFMSYACDVSGNYLNYTKSWKAKKEIVHPTKYTYCQNLAARARAAGVDYLLVPSARKYGGCCVPVFRRPASKVRGALQSFDVCWDRKKKMAFIEDGTKREYVVIDKVYNMV